MTCINFRIRGHLGLFPHVVISSNAGISFARFRKVDCFLVMTSKSEKVYKCKYGETDLLTHQNYDEWERCMSAFLDAEDALRICESGEFEPDGLADEP